MAAAAELLTTELEPLEAFLATAAAVFVSMAAYLTAKLRLGWWRHRTPPR